METARLCLLLLALLALSGIVTRHLLVPTPFVQIGLGALAGWPARGLHVEFEPELFLLLFIPPLLFVDAWRIPKRELIRNRTPVILLALGLVLFTIVGVGSMVHWLVPAIPLTAAFALAAVLSPTDAVALSAITAGSKMPARLQGILQGEALLNDASGLVSFKFALAAALTGVFSLGSATLGLLVIGLGGLVIGAALAFVFGWTLRFVGGRADGDTATESLLMLLLPIAAYMLAERFGASGILSAVAAGLAMDSTGFSRRGGAVQRTQGRFVWGMVEFVFNGLIFLLLGLYVPINIRSAAGTQALVAGHLGKVFVLIGAITLALIALRFVWVCATLPVEGWIARRARLEWRWPGLRAVCAASLSGLRGAIALAGILSLPRLMPDGSPFPQRDLMIEVVLGVVLCSLLLGAVGLPPLLRGLPASAGAEPKHARRAALVAAAKAALAAVEARQGELLATCNERQAGLCRKAASALIARYRHIIDRGAEVGQPMPAGGAPTDAELAVSFGTELRLIGLQAARDELHEAKASAQIDERTVKSLSAELDLTELSLRSGSRSHE
jgi:Na+/H+ antiporter